MQYLNQLINDKDKAYASFWYVSFAIYPFNSIVSAFVGWLGFGFIASKMIYLSYSIVMLLLIGLLIKYKISLKSVVVLFGIYIFYLLMYISADPRIQHQFLTVKMITIYVFYLPQTVFILPYIRNMRFISREKIFVGMSYGIVIGALISKRIFHDPSNYMTYAHALLPVWVLTALNVFERFKMWKLIMIYIIYIEGVFYGARGPLVWFTIAWMIYAVRFLFCYRMTVRSFILSVLKLIVMMSLTVIVITVLYRWLSTQDTSNSYVLNRLFTGRLTEGAGRIGLYEAALFDLSHMGIAVRGFFYDRLVTFDGSYVHNVVLETLIDFGWGLGSLILVALTLLLSFAYIHGDKIMFIFIMASWVLKYTIGGSIYEDEASMFALALFIAQIRYSKKKQ